MYILFGETQYLGGIKSIVIFESLYENPSNFHGWYFFLSKTFYQNLKSMAMVRFTQTTFKYDKTGDFSSFFNHSFFHLNTLHFSKIGITV